MKKNFKQDKGTAGLTILLSVVVMLFVIGLLIYMFALMGIEMQNATFTSSSASVSNESITIDDRSGGVALAGASIRNAVCTIGYIRNATLGVSIGTGNYTQINCNLQSSGSNAFNGTVWNVTYTYIYDKDNDVTETMNATVQGLIGTTDWFDIFVVIAAMVVLILLTVIIITSIRSSGMVAGASSGANNVGTA